MAAEIEVVKLKPGDLPRVLPDLARAFAPQPFTHWLVGDDARTQWKGEQLLALDFEEGLRYDLAFTTPDFRGVALWYPPDREESFWENLILMVQLVRVLGARPETWRHIKAFLRSERAAPEGSYYYLAMLAVAPGYQGQGIGSALIQPMLDRCDAEGRGAYLETDTEPNLRFYRRHGFEIRDELVFTPEVTLWTMWRDPQSPPETPPHTAPA